MKILFWIIAVIGGVMLGISLGCAIVVSRIRKNVNHKICTPPEDLTDDEKHMLLAVVKDAKKKYRKSQKSRFGRKILKLKPKRSHAEKLNYLDLIRSTAVIFNPQSVSPWLEISERELFEFGFSVADKLREILDATGLKRLKTLTVEGVVDVLSFADKILKVKGVRGFVSVADKAIIVFNAINPFFWLKRAASAVVTLRICDEVIYASIETVAYEFAALYDKSAARYETAEDETAIAD